MSTVDLPPLYDDLTFLSPLSEERAGRLVRWLAQGLRDGGTVVDVGCGWGELLLRVVEAAPAAHGVGIDLEEDRTEEGRRRAERRGIAHQVTLSTEDAAGASFGTADALVAIGASQIWGAGHDTSGPLDYDAALTAIHSAVRPGARVVYGEAIWSRPPTPEATAPLGGRDDEFVTLPELAELATDRGFAVVGVQEASLDEWDQFESGFCAGYATWLATHPADHPDAAAVRDRAARQRAAYLRGYRGVLGLAYLQLLAV